MQFIDDKNKAADLILSIDPLRQILVEKLQEQLSPSTCDLLKLKDWLMISDAKWRYVEKTFNLGKHGRIYAIRKLRGELNEAMDISPTNTGNGATLNVLNIVRNMIRKEKPKDNTLTMKFVFGSCHITSNIDEVIGTITSIHKDKTSKSPTNADQFIVWIGTETYEQYQSELATVKNVINDIVANKRKSFSNTEKAKNLFTKLF